MILNLFLFPFRAGNKGFGVLHVNRHLLSWMNFGSHMWLTHQLIISGNFPNCFPCNYRSSSAQVNFLQIGDWLLTVVQLLPRHGLFLLFRYTTGLKPQFMTTSIFVYPPLHPFSRQMKSDATASSQILMTNLCLFVLSKNKTRNYGNRCCAFSKHLKAY